MAERQTEGPVEVLTNDVESLNRAYATLVERIDEVKGLRGESQVSGSMKVKGALTGEDQGAWTYKDKAGVVIHGWGNVAN